MVLRYWEKERPSVAWWQRACSYTIRRPENTLVGSSWVKNGRKQMGHTDAAVPTMHTQTRDARLTIHDARLAVLRRTTNARPNATKSDRYYVYSVWGVGCV